MKRPLGPDVAGARPDRPATVAHRGGRGYETWSKRDLYQRAKELGVPRRHRMTKAQLIGALRRGRSPHPDDG